MAGSMRILKFAGTIALVIFFYASSICLTFYNKWMSKKYTFPLTVAMVHFVTVFLLAAFFRRLLEIYQKEDRAVLDWKVYIKKVFPSAISASLDIGLSNWSIMLSTVSLYTMAKSTAIIFILLFSVMLGLERPTKSLILVVLLISVGLFLFTFNSSQFDMFGFVIALIAALFSGLRWTTTQLLMQKKSMGLQNPLDAIFHIQPVMALTMVVFAFSMEGPQFASSSLIFRYSSFHVLLTSLVIILSGAFLAFLLTISEYLMVSQTSSLALSIAGILKELVTLTIAAELGGDRMNGVNVIGLIICMTGISVHVVSKALNENNTGGSVNRALTDDENHDSIAFKSLLTEEDFDEEILFESNHSSKGGKHSRRWSS